MAAATVQATEAAQAQQLLDTQLLLWLAITPARLLPGLGSALGDRRIPFLFSMASLREVAIQHHHWSPQKALQPDCPANR